MLSLPLKYALAISANSSKSPWLSNNLGRTLRRIFPIRLSSLVGSMNESSGSVEGSRGAALGACLIRLPCLSA